MNPKDKAVLDAIVNEITDFEADLWSENASRHANNTEYLREQLELLFDLICNLNQFKRKHKIGRAKYIETDRAILQAWQAAFSAIEALSSWAASSSSSSSSSGDEATRHHFIAARLLLFLMHALTLSFTLPVDMEKSKVSRERVRLQMAFNIQLDEALLSHLRAVWDGSGRRDIMQWTMTHMARASEKHDGFDSIRVDINRAAIRALSPAELWEIPGMTGSKQWVATEGEEPVYEMFKDATSATFGDGPKKNGKTPIVKQTLFSEGPIYTDNAFCLFQDEDEEWLRGPRFTRSLQFILDVRQLSHPWLVQERQRLARQAGELPNELRHMIATNLGAMESPDVHPYLSHLDLSAVYASLPAWDTKDEEKRTCHECGEAADKSNNTRHLTCPAATIYIWNRALRAFHAFHPKSKKDVVMCADGVTCTGHHQDDSHDIKDHESLKIHLQDIVQSRCGPDVTLESVGLGGREWLMRYVQREGGGPIPSAMKTYGLGWRDVESEVRATGGWLCLELAMAREECDMPCFHEDGVCQATTRMNVPWAWSKDEDEENMCKKHLKVIFCSFRT